MCIYYFLTFLQCLVLNTMLLVVSYNILPNNHLCSAHSCLLAVTRYLECFVDFALVVMALVAFTIAAVCLDQPTQFSHQNNNQIVYFTLATFWNTYSHMVHSVVCVLFDCNTLYLDKSVTAVF